MKQWLLLCFLLLNLFCLLNSSDVPGFQSDGSLSLLIKAQHIVETKVASRDIESTVFGIKYRSAQILCSITKYKNESANEYKNDDCMLPSSIFYKKDDRTLACFVGRRADCLQGRREIIEFVENYEQSTGSSISALRLALALADKAHEQTMYPMRMPLAFNSMIIGSHSILKNTLNETIKDNDNTTDSNSTNIYIPNLFRIDVSGNFYRCDATSAGNMALQIKNWIQTKGKSLLLNITEIDNNDDFSVDTNNNDDILVALGLVYHCLVDNYFLENNKSTKNNNSTYDSFANNNSLNSYTNIELAFNFNHYHNNNIMGPFPLTKNIFLINNNTDSIKHRGLKIWTFLKQSKFI